MSVTDDATSHGRTVVLSNKDHLLSRAARLGVFNAEKRNLGGSWLVALAAGGAIADCGTSGGHGNERLDLRVRLM